MELKTIVSKEAHLLAELYDLIHVPAFQNPESPLYLFYHGSFSQFLYYGYLLETKKLWKKVFEELTGIKSDWLARKYLGEIERIEVFRWNEIESILKSYREKLVELYALKKSRIRGLLSRVLGINVFFDKIYVILAFNPLHGLYGSLPVYDENEKYAIVSVFVSLDTSVEKILDIMIHEIIHGLIRINEIDIPDENEEEFIDTLCPEGYLSRELGLTSEINIEKSSLSSIVEKYFNDKLYRETDLVNYIKKYKSNEYLL